MMLAYCSDPRIILHGRIMRLALAIFIIVPILEMVVLIEVGGIIGALPTILLVVLTATIGIWLLKLEGIATFNRFQQKMATGQLPETELLEGIMLLVGGALLLTPGFVTDAVGFTCLLPGLRRPIARWIMRQTVFRAFGAFQPGNATFHTSFDAGKPSGTDQRTIEGEYRKEDDPP
jgi:UPF0716 protein FxsA